MPLSDIIFLSSGKRQFTSANIILGKVSIYLRCSNFLQIMLFLMFILRRRFVICHNFYFTELPLALWVINILKSGVYLHKIFELFEVLYWIFIH